MLDERKKWVALGATAIVLVAGSSFYLFRLWRSKDGLQTLAVARLSRGSDDKVEAEAAPAAPAPVSAFHKSAAYLEAAAETRRKLRSSPGIGKEALLALRAAVRELVAPAFAALHVQSIGHRQAYLENIPEWSALYAAYCEDAARLVAAAEAIVCADCGIAEREYRDHHRALEQKDHQYMIACIKMLEVLKSECRKRKGEAMSAASYCDILDYKLTLARNVPLEAFPVAHFRAAEHKWHIIGELAYQKFGFLNGDVPSAVFESPPVAEKQKKLVDEFLLQSFAGLALPN